MSHPDEFARAARWPHGAPAGTLTGTSRGTLEAIAYAEGVSLVRRIGRVVPVAPLTWEEVERLAQALALWPPRVEEWAAYIEPGVPVSRFALQVYVPPDSRVVKPGGRLVGVRSGRGRAERGHVFRASDEVRALATPVGVCDGARHVADLWRSESDVGPAGGEKVGERWEIEGGWTADLRRCEADLTDGRRRLWFTPGEGDFLATVLPLRARVAPAA